MPDLEIYRSRHRGYIRPTSKAGEKFLENAYDPDDIGPDGMVSFNLEFFEDTVESLKRIAEGLDIEIR